MSAHDDYLDPDIHLWPLEDNGEEAFMELQEKLDAAIRERDTARAQRDRAMEIVHADVLSKREHDEYRAIRAEIAKEKEGER